MVKLHLKYSHLFIFFVPYSLAPTVWVTYALFLSCHCCPFNAPPPSIILWFLCIVPRPIQFPVSSAQLFLCFHSELRWETVMHGSAVDGTVALQQEGLEFKSRLGPGLTCVSPAVRLPATQMWISRYRK